jgi:hypothetical protein
VALRVDGNMWFGSGGQPKVVNDAGRDFVSQGELVAQAGGTRGQKRALGKTGHYLTAGDYSLRLPIHPPS